MRRIFALHALVLTALSLSGCGSPRTSIDHDTALDQAIERYIDGDFGGAETLLTRIIGTDGSNADHATAYLYLGKIYLARGDYQQAADAFSAGRALGGDIRFAEYFEEAQRHLTATARRIAQLPRVTRGQLAALIGEQFGDRLSARSPEAGQPAESDDVTRRGSGTVASAPAETPKETPAEFSVALLSGVMTLLPDGGFHAEEPVTMAAFYAVMRRLSGALGLRGDSLHGLFPGGYRAAAEAGGKVGVGGRADAAGTGGPDGSTGEFVTGYEARRFLEALDEAAGSDSE